MKTHADRTKENKRQSAGNKVSQKQNSSESTLQFVDNRPEAVTRSKLQEMANTSSRAEQAAQLKAITDNYSARAIQKQESMADEESLQGKFELIQKQGLEEEELLQGRFEPIQKLELEEEEPLQGKFEPIQKEGIAKLHRSGGKIDPDTSGYNDTRIKSISRE